MKKNIILFSLCLFTLFFATPTYAGNYHHGIYRYKGGVVVRDSRYYNYNRYGNYNRYYPSMMPYSAYRRMESMYYRPQPPRTVVNVNFPKHSSKSNYSNININVALR